MREYEVIDCQQNEPHIDKNLVRETIGHIFEYHQHNANYNVNFSYDLGILLLNNYKQGIELYPNLLHDREERFVAMFQPIKLPNTYKKSSCIILYTDMLLQEAEYFGYRIETMMFFYLAHEVQHFIQYSYLKYQTYLMLMRFEKNNYKDTNDVDFYKLSQVENEANFFAYNFIKNYHLEGNHPVFNSEIQEDVKDCYINYFPNYVSHDQVNGHNAYKFIKVARGISLVLKGLFAIIIIVIVFFLLNY